jgi:hypothetical protein
MLLHNPFQPATPPVVLGPQKTPHRRADPTSGTPTMMASTPATSGKVTLIGYLPWPITTATGISIPSEFTIIRRAGTDFADADFGYFDENQDGKITRSEFVNKPSEFIVQYDKNSDCRVTQDEMKGASTDQKPSSGKGKKF